MSASEFRVSSGFLRTSTGGSAFTYLLTRQTQRKRAKHDEQLKNQLKKVRSAVKPKARSHSRFPNPQALHGLEAKLGSSLQGSFRVLAADQSDGRPVLVDAVWPQH